MPTYQIIQIRVKYACLSLPVWQRELKNTACVALYIKFHTSIMLGRILIIKFSNFFSSLLRVVSLFMRMKMRFGWGDKRGKSRWFPVQIRKWDCEFWNYPMTRSTSTTYFVSDLKKNWLPQKDEAIFYNTKVFHQQMTWWDISSKELLTLTQKRSNRGIIFIESESMYHRRMV